MTHLTRNNNPNVFASLPFDQIDGFAGVSIHDDFLAAVTTADYIDPSAGAAQPSDFPWQGSEIAATAAVANGLVIPGEADHAGILQLQSGTVGTPADGDGVAIQLGDDASNIQDTLVLDDNGVYMAAVVRQPDKEDSRIGFQLEGQEPVIPNTVAADIVGVIFDPDDSDNTSNELFFGQVAAASTDTEVIGAVTYVQNDWVLLEVSANDTSAEFRITTEDGTESLELINTMPTVALRPSISTSTGDTSEALLDVDLFHFRYLRRDSLLGNAADWLGA